MSEKTGIRLDLDLKFPEIPQHAFPEVSSEEANRLGLAHAAMMLPTVMPLLLERRSQSMNAERFVWIAPSSPLQSN